MGIHRCDSGTTESGTKAYNVAVCGAERSELGRDVFFVGRWEGSYQCCLGSEHLCKLKTLSLSVICVNIYCHPFFMIKSNLIYCIVTLCHVILGPNPRRRGSADASHGHLQRPGRAALQGRLCPLCQAADLQRHVPLPRSSQSAHSIAQEGPRDTQGSKNPARISPLLSQQRAHSGRDSSQASTRHHA
mmetsp:Transcript_34548/g.50601  ORF Transcript_34548/g.50601 Transcript_34548/m.50601 type:complete len:188 (-) Transcript_34548:771-1334(-)